MSKKILVVDESPNTLNSISETLTDSGYEVIKANDGVAAKEKIWAEKPDLVCLDIVLPEESGVKLFHEMREDDQIKSIPVVIIDDIEDRDAGAGRYMQFERFLAKQSSVRPPEGYVDKPTDRDELVREVRKALG